METFSVKFRAGNLDEPEPVLLNRSLDEEWTNAWGRSLVKVK